jgi:hypothetical protein
MSEPYKHVYDATSQTFDEPASATKRLGWNDDLPTFTIWGSGGTREERDLLGFVKARSFDEALEIAAPIISHFDGYARVTMAFVVRPDKAAIAKGDD